MYYNISIELQTGCIDIWDNNLGKCIILCRRVHWAYMYVSYQVISPVQLSLLTDVTSTSTEPLSINYTYTLVAIKVNLKTTNLIRIFIAIKLVFI